MKITENNIKNFSFQITSSEGGTITMSANGDTAELAKQKIIKDLKHALAQFENDEK